MSNQTYVGPSAITLIGVLFVGLKLGGAIDWSWWWVLLPFYWGLGLMALTFVSVFVLGMCLWVYRVIFR
jgi:hypothetical protein